MNSRSSVSRLFDRTMWWLWGIVGAVGLLLLLAPVVVVNVATASHRYNANEGVDWVERVPTHDVAIVFGAGVQSDGTPTPYLKQRIHTAAELLQAGKVQKILMSGDNSVSHYNEPAAMAQYAQSVGVPEEAVVLDYAGYSTYDTCYRARHIFGLGKAVVVTQGYHLPRTVATCTNVGVQSTGVAALRQGRDFTITYILREVLSVNKAVIQMLAKPTPAVLGDPEPIRVRDDDSTDAL